MKLMDALSSHNSLIKLRLWGNDLDTESTAALALLCEKMDSLEECDVLVQMVDRLPMPVKRQDLSTTYFPGRV